MKNNKIHKAEDLGFKVPEGYFDSFEDKLMSRLNDDLLSEIRSPGFKAPEGYFESVEEKIITRIHSTGETPVIPLRQNKRWYYIAGIAASVILALAVFFNPASDTALSAEMVESYLANSNLNSYELAELLSEAELLDDDFKIIETQYDEDNLESYLLDHMDIETLIE